MDHKTWSISAEGVEEISGSSESERHADDMVRRLKPCSKTLRRALRAGQGIGIENLQKVQMEMVLVS
jgi:hypothetical protein